MVGAMYFGAFASLSADTWVESHSFVATFSALKAYRAPPTGVFELKPPPPVLPSARVAHTMPVPVVEPLADTEISAPCESPPDAVTDPRAAAVVLKTFVVRLNEKAPSVEPPGQTYMKDPEGPSHHAGPPTIWPLVLEPEKRWTICVSGGEPAWKCPIESPVVLTTYRMPFLPPATINDVPGISMGPELPMSVSALSSDATSEGMNHEPTAGDPETPTFVSLMNAFASCVPVVFVVPERPSPLTMYRLPAASTGKPPPPCHSPPWPVLGFVKEGV